MTAVTPESITEKAAATLADDLLELREMVQGTYEEIQLTLQQQKEQVHHDAIQTAAAAFQLAMGASLKRINELAATATTEPKKVTDHPQQSSTLVMDSEDLQAASKLTWYLLRVAPFLPSPNQSILVLRSTGALVESYQWASPLISDEHCGFVFLTVAHFVRLRKKTQESTDGDASQQIKALQTLDTVLQALCPPLMVYFCKRLSVLAKLRQENPDIPQILQVWQRPIDMIRRFILQAIDETILIAWVEPTTSTEDASDNIISSFSITYGQRVTVSGLYTVKDLVEWIRSNLDDCACFRKAEKNIELSSWTGLYDLEGGIGRNESERIKPHRIYQEGSPDDIPLLDGYGRIIMCYKGDIERNMKGKTFPMIDLKVAKQGTALSKEELLVLEGEIRNASTQQVETALEHQMRRGSKDGMIQQVIMRLSMLKTSLDTVGDLN